MRPLETPTSMSDRLLFAGVLDGGTKTGTARSVIREDRRVIAEAAEQRAAEYEINGYGPEAGALRAFARALRGEP